MEIKTDTYKKEGLYLHFADGDFLDFSKEHVMSLGDEYWNNPSKLPPHIRENEHFKTCTVCPYRGKSVFCSAMKPLLPFLETIEKFLSYDRVTAIYVKQKDIIYVSDTTMQNALQYLTNMSLFEYCEDAKQYHHYFQGIIPLMSLKKAACQLFLNIYWLNKGNRKKVTKTIDEMKKAVTITSQSCVKRLKLMCSSDAFMNAYVKTQFFTEALSVNIDAALEKYFEGAL